MSGSTTPVTISGLNSREPQALTGTPKAGYAALSDGTAVVALMIGHTPDGKPVQIEVEASALPWLGQLVYEATCAQARLAAFLPREVTG
jgi:hypothetical protein